MAVSKEIVHDSRESNVEHSVTDFVTKSEDMGDANMDEGYDAVMSDDVEAINALVLDVDESEHA